MSETKTTITELELAKADAEGSRLTERGPEIWAAFNADWEVVSLHTTRAAAMAAAPTVRQVEELEVYEDLAIQWTPYGRWSRYGVLIGIVDEEGDLCVNDDLILDQDHDLIEEAARADVARQFAERETSSWPESEDWPVAIRRWIGADPLSAGDIY